MSVSSVHEISTHYTISCNHSFEHAYSLCLSLAGLSVWLITIATELFQPFSRATENPWQVSRNIFQYMKVN
jgi:hypothetical protein